MVITLGDYMSGVKELLDYKDFVGSVLKEDLGDILPEGGEDITLSLCNAYLAIDQHLGFLKENIAKSKVADDGSIIVTTMQVKNLKFVAEATDRALKDLRRFNIDVTGDN